MPAPAITPGMATVRCMPVLPVPLAVPTILAVPFPAAAPFPAAVPRARGVLCMVAVPSPAVRLPLDVSPAVPVPGTAAWPVLAVTASG